MTVVTKVDPMRCKHARVEPTNQDWAWIYTNPGTPRRRKVPYRRVGRAMNYEVVRCLDCGLIGERAKGDR